MEIERKWLIDGFPAGLPLLKEARVRKIYFLLNMTQDVIFPSLY